MERAGKLLAKSVREKTHEEKVKDWQEKLIIRLDQWKALYESVKLDGVRREIIALHRSEIDGNPCPSCGQRWRENEYENIFGYVHYFSPACECYPLCPHCKKWLYFEQVAGKLLVYNQPKNLKCSECGWMLMLNGAKRYGPSYEQQGYIFDYRQELFDKMNRKNKIKEEDL